MEALGGPRERITATTASELSGDMAFSHPLCVAIEVHGDGPVMPAAPGLEDDWFENDGQITKRPIRALTLSALAPRPGEHLWDVGGGSGSVAIEWLLAHPSLCATSVEIDASRAEQIRRNAERLGADRLNVVTGAAPDALDSLDSPDAVFVGGGLTVELLSRLADLAKGARIVANGVTLEAETLLADAQTRFGGDLMRIEISNSTPLGAKRGWRAAYPIVQWRGTL